MDDQSTACQLAEHPRWELRGGMLVLDTRCDEWKRCGDAWVAARADCGEPGWSSYVPDLADDATAGILLGMVREWCDNHADALFSTVYHRGEWSVLITARGLYQAPFAAPTLGEAAGRCLLACWEYDAEEGR